MSNKAYPYVNHMNILHNPLEKIDIPALVQKCTDKRCNQMIETVGIVSTGDV